jgi:hypothetical protein
MATFSLGTSGVTPGAPGVYINEQPGKVAFGGIADFSTVYMLVETEEDVPVTRFPFNTPIAISSLNDYKELIRIGTSTVPESRIPLLSYNCVNEFFQNAVTGDLRVVRVGTPDQIVEVEFFPSATKINSSSLPSSLQAGNKVFVQMILNGQKLVAGDGSTGYTADGEWLGVPVTIPVSYVAGDEANNRKISAAIAAAVSEAIESNPAIRSSVYVRRTGLLNDLDPSSNSENSYVTIASTTFNGNVSVITEVLPVGSNFVFMQNTYDVQNIVGGSVSLERVPQDYTQTISTAFDGAQDQGYLITPTAYAQFDAAGRALVGAAAAAHCENNNFKWMALADPGPYLITDVNEYQDYTPHQPAADLETGLKYLVDNAIYKWIGANVSYPKLARQTIVPGESAETAVNESANLVAAATEVGLLDNGQYTINAVPTAVDGVFQLDTDQYWPVTLPVQQVTLTGASFTSDFVNVSIAGGATNVNLVGTEVFVVAPPRNTATSSEYSLNYVFLATTAQDASAIYEAVVLLGGSVNVTTPPNGAVFIPAPTGDTALLTYADPYWNLPVTINGQTSDLIENTSGASTGVNTLHLPGTLQNPTESYALNWVSRTIYNPSAAGFLTVYSGTLVTTNAAVFNVPNHGLISGQKIYFTQPVTVTNAGVTTNFVSQTSKLVSNVYYVKVLNAGQFVIASTQANYTAGSFMVKPSGTFSTTPTIFYSQVLGRGLTNVSPIELLTLPMIRGRKYAFDSNSIFNQAADASLAPGTAVTAGPGSAIYLNNSAVILGEAQVTPYGEDLSISPFCGWLPSLNLVAPTTSPVAGVKNAYTTPTVDQFFQPEAYFVPAIEAISVGTYTANVSGSIGPATTLTVPTGGTTTLADGNYPNVPVSGGSGSGLVVTVTVSGGTVTDADVTSGGQGYLTTDTGLSLPVANFTGTLINVTGINTTGGSVTAVAASTYATQLGLTTGDTAAQLQATKSVLVGTYFTVLGTGFAPDGTTPVVANDRIALTYDGSTYSWVVVPAASAGGDLSSVGQVCYNAQVELVFTPEQGVTADLWRFDAITATEIIDNALRGVGFNGDPQAEFIEAGVDNVNRLLDDSQRYGNAFGFIAYYGPYIENGAGQFIPPSPYVTGVAVRRYRAEGYQFPPAGVKYQLRDAVAVQIPVNSAQQNLLNPKGCNVVRTLPGYPDSAVFIWGGRTRLLNPDDAQQKLYQFVNTRVILNVVYGSLRTAFDSQIFNVIDGFNVIFNQIVLIGNSILNQLYVRGALFGARPSDAFQVICDPRINLPEDLENGIVNAKVFVTPVPTLERIQIDLIRVAIGQMQNELDIQGLGQ